MNLVTSFLRLLSRGGKAAALYDSGMAKANRDDWAGALDDYSAVLASAHAPRDLQAMAYFNRALVHAHQGHPDKAQADLQAAIALPGAPPNIKAAAQEKLTRWGKRRVK